MTVRRKVGIAAIALFALALVGLALLPLLFKDQIAGRVRAGIERRVEAQVDWSSVGVTFFRDFPNLTLRLDGLTVVGVENFAGDTLVQMDGFRLELDAGSLLGGLRGTRPFLVRSVLLDRPDARLRVLEDGSANWDIARGGEAATPAAPGTRNLSVDLRDLEIAGGTVVLDDARTGLYVALEGLQHELSGNFSQQRFTIDTRTRADATTLRFAGIPYLESVEMDFAAALDADAENRSVTFADNRLRLNALAVEFSGSAAQADGVLALDVTFGAPQTEFGQVLSLVPVVYAHDFAALQTAGTFTLQGHVRGDLGEAAFPSFAVNAEIADGMFRYPDLPLAARDIAGSLAVENPGGDVDSTVVRMRGFRLRLGEQPVEGALTLRTPVSDPDVDVAFRGTVDLGDVVRTVKIDDIGELDGVVRADAAVRARMSDIDGRRWDRVEARGLVAATGVTVQAEALPHAIAVEEATLDLSPRRAELRSLRMQIGSSDLEATGYLENVLGFVLRDGPLQGRATFASRHFDLDEWRSDESQLRLIPVPPGVDLVLDGTVDELSYGAMAMSDARGGLHVKDQRVELEDFTVGTLGGRIAVTGSYETTDPLRPTFNVSLAMDSLDIPGSSAAMLTVRMLAPVARFARGAFTANLNVSGALGSDMAPIFDALDGNGSLFTTNLSMEGFPALARLAETLSLPQLSNPTFQAIRSSIEIRGGRLHVRPFRVGVGDFRMGISGSNGVDQSLDYTLGLELPRAALGSRAAEAVQALVTRAGRAGVDLQAADTVVLTVALGGSVLDPSIRTDFTRVASSAGEQARQAVGEAVERRIDAAEERVDSTAEAARQRAQARADSIILAAEERAATVRAEARRLADGLREEGNRRADQLLAEATNPVARAAARPVADRIRREADQRATALVDEADQRAEQLIAEARERADAILRGGG